MADSLISIFMPILVYKYTNDLNLAFIYLITYASTLTLSYAFLKKFIQKYSVGCIFIHIIFLIVLQFILTLELNVYLIIIIAILSGIQISLYYGSLNLIFGTIEKKNNVSKFEAGNYVGKIVFCILSAYILGNVQDSLLFVVIASSVLYLLSLIPILICRKELKVNYDTRKIVEPKTVLKFNLKMYIPISFLNIFSAFRNYILPLYLFVNGLSFTMVGVLVALNYVIQIFAGYLTRYLDSKHLNTANLIINCSIMCGCIFSIIFLKDVVIIYIITIFLGFSYQMLYVLMFSKFVKMQKDGYYYHALFQRDVFQNFAKVCSDSIYFLGFGFLGMFGFGIIACIGLAISGCKIFMQEDGEKNINNSKTNEKIGL